MTEQSADHLRFWKVLAWLLLILFLFALTTYWFLFAPTYQNLPVLSSLPLDDAFIHLAYARGLVSEHCPCFNQGIPEAGMTSPLWVLFLSGIYWFLEIFGMNPLAGAKILSAFFGLLCAIIIGFLLRTSPKEKFDLSLTLVVSGLMVLEPHFNYSRLAGMEVTMTAFFILLTILFWAKAHPFWLGLSAGLSIWSRPENLLLTALLLVGLLFKTLNKRQKWSCLVWFLVPVLVFIGLWCAYNYSVSGKPLPNTYYSKAVSFTLFNWQNLRGLISKCIFQLAEFQFGFGVFFFLIGAYYLLTRGRSLWLVLVYPWLFIYGLSGSRIFLFFEGYYFNRYFQPVIPLLIIPVGIGLVASFRAGFKYHQKHRGWLSRSFLFFLLLLLAGLLSREAIILREQRNYLAQDCDGIEYIFVQAGKWIDLNLPKEAVIAAFDVGALRFYGKRKIIDLYGLNSHQVLDDFYSFLFSEKPGYYFLPMEYEKARQLQKGVWYQAEILEKVYAVHRPIYFIFATKYSGQKAIPIAEVLFEVKY